MFNLTVAENLGFLASHAELEAERLESEMWNPDSANIQRTAPEVLRQRAERYRAAQAEMLDDIYAPTENALAPRPSKSVMWVARAALAGSAATLLYLVVHIVSLDMFLKEIGLY